MRRAPLLLLSCTLACGDAGDPATTTEATTAAPAATGGLTTGEASGASEATTSAPTTGVLTASSDTGDSSGGTDSTTGEPAPHVEIVDGALRIDGTPTFLYGGDLHYFRVRDKDFDAAKTRAMWAETLDAMQAAGMNLVTTYVPWDYHSPGPGEFDFSGARDVGAFLKMVCDRGMHVVYKPGPLITGEWPRGFGSFGAVPQWWKLAHPEALVRDTKGALWTYSPTGDEDQRQPSYLHPTYLAAVKEWYAAALAPARPFLGGCIVAVQVDNETNMYWGDRFGGVDYSDPALAAYREFLQAKYGDIAALNARYGTQHADFGDVLPPGQAPGSGQSEWAKNPWYADWYAAGQAQVRQYLEALKQMLTDEGFAPPQALHFTNDSPFALLLGDVLLRNVLVHDGLTKTRSVWPGSTCIPSSSRPTTICRTSRSRPTTSRGSTTSSATWRPGRRRSPTRRSCRADFISTRCSAIRRSRPRPPTSYWRERSAADSRAARFMSSATATTSTAAPTTTSPRSRPTAA